MMRRLNLCALLVLVALCTAFLAGAADAKPRVSIKKFVNKTDTSGANAPADAITDMMSTELYEADIFTIIERERLEEVGEEVRLGQSGLVDESTAPQLGKIKGARYMLTGAITVYYYNMSGGVVGVPGIAGGGAGAKTGYVTLNVRIVDNQTGEVVYSATKQGEAKHEASGILTVFGGFGNVQYGGVLATATQDSVRKHVEAMKKKTWEE
jgi:curli biogenesis system outer membrane secretion channel CsgG